MPQRVEFTQTPIFYLSVRAPRHFGNATQPQNMCRSPPGRVALLGAIGFEHLGHTGAAAANISGYASVWRIFLVELPISTNLQSLSSVERLCQPAACRAVTRFRFALVWLGSDPDFLRFLW